MLCKFESICLKATNLKEGCRYYDICIFFETHWEYCGNFCWLSNKHTQLHHGKYIAESFVQNHLYRLEAKKLWLLILKARTLHASLDIRVFRMVFGHSKFE